MLSFDIEANGYGAILATPSEPSDAIKTLMQRMAELTKTPLDSFSHAPSVLPQTIVDIRRNATGRKRSCGHDPYSRRRVRLHGAGH